MGTSFQSGGDDYYDPFGKQDGGNNGGSAGSSGSGGGYGSFGSGGGNSGNQGGNGQGGGYQNGNGYGSFGNNNGYSNGQNNGQGSGSFYGPDYFSGRSGGYGGYGYGAPQGAPRTPAQKSPGYGFSLAAMICGIAAFVLCSAYTMLPLGVAAIVFAILGKKRDGKMSGFAIAGLVLGIVAVLIGACSLVISFLYRDELRAYIEELLRQLEGSGQTVPDNGSGTPNDGGTLIFRLPRLL